MSLEYRVLDRELPKTGAKKEKRKLKISKKEKPGQLSTSTGTTQPKPP